MVDLTGKYDVNAEASTGYEPIPAGKYVARIVNAERAAVSRTNDNGECLTFTWKVEGGDYDGRLFWQRINLWFRGNNDAVVCDIANRQLAAVREATGVKMPTSTDELLEIPCLVTWGPQKNRPEYMEVKGVRAVDGSAPSVAAPPSQAAKPTTPASTAKANPFKRAAGR